MSSQCAKKSEFFEVVKKIDYFETTGKHFWVCVNLKIWLQQKVCIFYFNMLQNIIHQRISVDKISDHKTNMIYAN